MHAVRGADARQNTAHLRCQPDAADSALSRLLMGRHHGAMAAPPAVYSTRPLSPDTWDDFARLVEANNGVWGGCWCMGFHSEGLGKERTAADNKAAKQEHVRSGTVHQILVYAGDECVGWCQYGSPAELPNIKNHGAYAKDLVELPNWRIGCIFTGKGRRERGVARAAVSAALEAIRTAGGGVVEAYRSRSTAALRSGVGTSIPDRRRCSRSSASCGTVRSPSGAG
jgi:hypothetical protein